MVNVGFLKHQSRKLGLAPGVHVMTAVVHALGMVSRGKGTIQVGEGRVFLEDLTPPGLHYGHSKKHKHRCHDMGYRVQVAARVTNYDHQGVVPMVGAKVHYRVNAVRLCSAVSDSRGVAQCSFVLSKETMLMDKQKVDPTLKRPYVKAEYNFEMEPNRLYGGAWDRRRLYRSWCACRFGTRWSEAYGPASPTDILDADLASWWPPG